MVVGKFSENFWGDKINGFDILCQNLKHSLMNVKELEAYFRECENIQDQYSKLCTKLAIQLNRYSTNGTFYPFWSPLKELNERLSTTHVQIMQQIRDIIKETQRYHDDLNKKIKRIRDNESQTQVCVQSFQEITQSLNKTKEQYHNLAIDLEKQKRAENTNVLKLEKKVKQSLDEYKTNIDKYNLIRNEYERKFTDACSSFQSAEEIHLKQMKTLIDNYSKVFLVNNQSIKQIYDEFHVKIDLLNVDVLVQTFIDNKRTGNEKPDAVSLIEPDYSKLPLNAANNSISSGNSTNSNNLSGSMSASNNYNTLNDNDFSLFLSSNTNISSSNNIMMNGGAMSNSNLVNNSSNNINSGSSNSNINERVQTSSSPFLNFNFLNSNSNSGSNSNNIGGGNSGNGTNANNSSNMTGSVANMPLLINSMSTNTINVNSSTSSTSSSSNDNMKRSDSRGFNIFNVDILRGNKSKEKKAQKTASKSKKKQDYSQSQQQQQQHNDFLQLNSKESNSINSDDTNEHRLSEAAIGVSSGGGNAMNSNNLNSTINSVSSANALTTARSGNSIITGSSSLDLLEQLKFSNGSDVDSEGYSIRPEYKGDKKKDNDDMNNFYGSSSTTDNDSDSEPEIGVGPTKVMLKIKPKTEIDTNSVDTNNSNVLLEISKNLQLKPLNLLQQPTLAGNASSSQKKRSYYSFGTLATPAQQQQQQNESIWPTNSASASGSTTPTGTAMSRSLSFGSSNSAATVVGDMGFANDFTKPPNLNQNKTNDSSLYNIDEDKEVESSFQFNKRNGQQQLTANGQANFSLPPPSSAPSIPGRFTPACFPGRTTPEFRHTTSLVDATAGPTTTRVVTSPLTVVNGNEIIPIAVAFNETVHAYFKLTDLSKFKVKCFGCMKISFPFAILKFISTELPQLEFRLSNFQTSLEQDLVVNSQLITKSLNESKQQHQYQFNTINLLKELKEQHQQNKQAAFFNFELLKYEFKYVDTAPLLLNATWSCKIINQNHIELRFNLDCTHNYAGKSLQNVNLMLVLSQQLNIYKIQIHQQSTEPKCLIQENEQKIQILWQLAQFIKSENFSAKFIVKITDKESFITANTLETICSQPLYCKFHVDNDTLSRVKFDILSMNYKLSLLREKIESGKYFCTPTLIMAKNETIQTIYEQLNVENSGISVFNNLDSIPNIDGVVDSGSPNNGDLTPTAGSISTQIGSSSDILFNY